jgi:hypothetical protein
MRVFVHCLTEEQRRMPIIWEIATLWRKAALRQNRDAGRCQYWRKASEKNHDPLLDQFWKEHMSELYGRFQEREQSKTPMNKKGSYWRWKRRLDTIMRKRHGYFGAQKAKRTMARCTTPFRERPQQLMCSVEGRPRSKKATL